MILLFPVKECKINGLISKMKSVKQIYLNKVKKMILEFQNLLIK